MPTLRIFISSPNDVVAERRRAELVVEKLAKDYRRFFDIHSDLWETEPMLASGDFQDNITPPADSDIVVLIVWSRLGTALPEKTARREYRGIDGRVPVTGTEWEFESALKAQRDKGAPDLLAYRKTADPTVSLKNPAAKIAAEEQWDNLEAFWNRHFLNRGIFKAAFSEFADLDGFETKFESDLRSLIEVRIKTRPGPVAAPVWSTGSPFRGLDTYRYEHRAIFFGRSAATKAAVEQLTENAEKGRAFLLILGASGAGKSSLAQAGVLPALVGRRGIVPGVGMWRWAVMRPAGHPEGPFAALAEAFLAKDGLPELLAPGQNAAALARHLEASVEDPAFSIISKLNEIAEAARRRGHLLSIERAQMAIVVDQVEELFTAAEITAGRRTAFVRCLDGLARSGNVFVIATMRNDYWHRAPEIPLLGEISAGRGRIDLFPATQSEIIEMIRQPAQAAGVDFETHPETEHKLDADLIEQAAGEPGALPLLSFVLDALYRKDVEENKGSTLTYASLRESGGLTGAIATRAESVFATLPAEDQEIIPRVMRALVTVSGSGSEPISRTAAISRFGEDSPERRIVKALIDARLLVADGDGEGARIRPAHEALLTHWKRLKQWIESDEDMLRTCARVAELATLWRGESERPDMLMQRGPLLAAAEELLQNRRTDLDDLVVEYVTASTEAAKRASDFLLSRLLTVQSGQVLARGELELAALLAVEALRRTTSPQLENDLALRSASRLLLRPIHLWPMEGRINSLAFSPDGRYVATASFDKTARMFEIASGQELFRVVHDGAVRAVAFSPDGRCVATASGTTSSRIGSVGCARVFEVTSGREVSRLLHDGAVNAVAFSPDGGLLATGSDDKTARVFEAATGHEVSRLVHENMVNAVAFSPDGGYVATASDDETARVFQAASGREVSRMVHENMVSAIAFSPDGRCVATASMDKTARVFEAATGREVSRSAHRDDVNVIAFSPDGRYVTVGSVEGARVFETANGREVSRSLPDGEVLAIAFSPDGRYVATGGDDKTARVFEAASGREVSQLVHDGPVETVAFSPDGRYLATGSWDKTARLSEAASVREVLRLVHGRETSSDSVDFTAVAFSPDGRYLATGSLDRTARVFEATSGREVFRLVHDGAVNAVAFGGDGRCVATASMDKGARVFEISSGRAVSTMVHDSAVWAVAFSHDGRYVATGESGATLSRLDSNGLPKVTSVGTARVFEVASGRELFRLIHGNWVVAVGFSPDGRYLATGSWDKSARVFEAASGQEVSRLVHGGPVNAVAFSPDGRHVATASSDRTARVFEASTGREMFRVNVGALRFLAFNSDGQSVVGAGEKGIAVVDTRRGIQSAWIAADGSVLAAEFRADDTSIESAVMRDDHSIHISHSPATPSALIADACSRVTRNLTPAEWKQYLGDEPYRKTCPNLPRAIGCVHV